MGRAFLQAWQGCQNPGCHALSRMQGSRFEEAYPQRARGLRQALGCPTLGLLAAKALCVQLADVPGLHRVIVKAEPLPTRRPLPLLLPHLAHQPATIPYPLCACRLLTHA